MIGPPEDVGDTPLTAVFTQYEAGFAAYDKSVGAAAFTTSNVKSNVSAPHAFVAVIVYTELAVTSVGVPAMTPVEASICRPAGRSGLTEKVDTSLPKSVVGALSEMVSSRTYDAKSSVYALRFGTEITVMATGKVAEPTEFVAVTV